MTAVAETYDVVVSNFDWTAKADPSIDENPVVRGVINEIAKEVLSKIEMTQQLNADYNLPLDRAVLITLSLFKNSEVV